MGNSGDGPGRGAGGPTAILGLATRMAGRKLRTFIFRHWAKVLGSVGALLVILLCVTGALYVLQQVQMRRTPPRIVETTAPVRIEVAPAGAVVRVDGQVRDLTKEIRLPPGSHTVSASLEGYEPGEKTFEVKASDTPIVEVRLNPKALSVRLFVRLSGANVQFDGRKVEASDDNWYVIPVVPDGKHVIEAQYATVRTKVNFETATGAAPKLDGPIEAKGALALAVTYAPGARAQFVASSGPVHVNLDGKDLGTIDATHPAEADLTAGEFPVLLQEAKRKDTPYTLAVGSSPFLALFLRTDLAQVNVEMDPSDAVVKLERQGKAAWGGKAGRRRIFPNLEPGEYVLHVEKDGYLPETRKISLDKGGFSNEKVSLKEKPKKGALEITGIPAGMEGTVLLDAKPIGPVSGAFRYTDVEPGRHEVKLNIKHQDSESLARPFAAGESVQLSFADFKLRKRFGRLDASGVRPAALVTATLTDDKGNSQRFRLSEMSAHGIVPLEFDVEYTAEFSAPGFKPIKKVIGVRDTPRESTYSVGQFGLEEIPKAPPPKQIVAETLPDWDNPNVWAPDKDGWKQFKKGQSLERNFSAGTITFEIRFSGSAKWRFDFPDDVDVNVELKKDKLVRQRAVGRKKDKSQDAQISGGHSESRQVRIVLRGGHLEHSIWDGGKWVALDDLTDAPDKGRFILSLNNRTYLKSFQYMPAGQ